MDILSPGKLSPRILSLARSAIVERSAYLAASPDRSLIRLHANESPWSLENAAGTSKPVAADDRELNRYPDPSPSVLLDRMSQYYGVPQDQVLPVRGSDDGIDLLIRAFCEATKDTITISSPTFSMYASFAGIQGAGIVDVPLLVSSELDVTSGKAAAFSLDPASIVKVAPASKLVFICTPNNPTGHSVSVKEIRQLCETLADKSLVVVDEAYIEFSPHDSVAAMLAEFENLVILRTLSKAFGAAGIRMGAVLAHPAIITLLRSISSPYALPTPVIELAIAAFAKSALDSLEQRSRYLSEQCRLLFDAMMSHPLVNEVYASDSNFLMARFDSPEAVCGALREDGVLVRDFSSAKGTSGCLRISTGYEDDNRKVLQTLDRLIKTKETSQ